MKNWKKVMAMMCAAAMLTGAAAPVWAADAKTEESADAESEYTELTMDMLEEAAYEGTWLSFEAGFDLYVPSDWDVLEISEEDQEAGLNFQAKAPDDSGVNMVVTTTDVGKEYDIDKLVDEFTDAKYTEIEKVMINGIYAVSFETDSTYSLAFLDDEGYMYNVQIGPKGDDVEPIAQNLFISLSKTEENEETDDSTETAEAAEEAATKEVAE